MKYKKSQVSIIIPCKNEGEGIRKIIRSVKSYGSEILVIDGHSEDNTKEIAQKENVLFFLDNKKGRGDAIRIGIQKAKGQFLVFVDADGSPDVTDIPHLLTPLSTNKADVVLASRRTGGSFDLNMTFSGILRSGGADLLTLLVNKRFNTNYSDILYSFRAIKKSVAKKLLLKSDDFTLEQEIVVSALKKGYRVLEVPSREKARAWGKSKLRTITGVKFLLYLIKDLYF